MTEQAAERRWVAVTGAASGIGAGIARTVAEHGYGVMLIDLDRERLDEVAAELPAATVVAADVTDPASEPALIDAARELGTMWALVNCAGVSLMKHFLLNSEEEWTRILRVNLEGTFRATHAIGTVLNENGGGAVVNISSVSGLNPAALQAAYAASKAGVIGFTEGLAFDFGPLDITVNVICPGVVRTPIWDRILDAEAEESGVPADEIFAEHVRPIPLGRAQTVEDIGEAVVYLIGPTARNVSGATLKLTGGTSTVVFDHLAGAEELRASLAAGER